ncbi:molybdopterin-dependent oxidoreductase [Streptomyces sp. Root369]|uniref:molybdopterin-dependent oxidoreductase n=1 Tax=Streptomyces sp. Root369 TaxID=1736523 RepID=UPI001F5B3C63|nr:molybdopterin-dependent oxidoreductase [Streptomyces sp. Root369]
MADSAAFAKALAALDLVVVIDIALTETGRQADYVLPAASQFEKWEAAFFTFEFPHNSPGELPYPPADPGKAAHPKIAGQYFRFLASCQRPESGAKPLSDTTCGAPSPRRTKISVQVRANPTKADSNGVELTSSGFSPATQSPESAPQMRRFRRSGACKVGRVGLEPTADGL